MPCVMQEQTIVNPTCTVADQVYAHPRVRNIQTWYAAVVHCTVKLKFEHLCRVICAHVCSLCKCATWLSNAIASACMFRRVAILR